MEHQNIAAVEAAPALPAFTIEALPLARALAILAPFATPSTSYNPTDARHCVLVDACPDAGVRFTVTDLETVASIVLPARVEMPGCVAVPARALSDAVRKLAKDSQATFKAEAERVAISAGRALFTVAMFPADGFPQFPLAGLTPAEEWALAGDDPAALGDGRAEGLVISEAAAKMIGKAVKRATPPKPKKNVPALPMPDAQLARFEPEEALGKGGYASRAPRLRIELGDMTVTAPLNEPALDYGRPKRSSFDFGYDAERTAQARTYARHLRDTYGLPDVEGHEGRLETSGGVALGMTFGEGYWDSSEYRPVPDWSPPAGTVIINEDSAMPECEAEGTRFAKLGDQPWHRWHAGSGGFAYPDGSYCVVFPRADRPVVSEIIVESGGETFPVATNPSGRINLTAERIAELCGPVDEMERVEIAPVAFYQGAPVPAGHFLPTPPKMSDRAAVRMSADEMRLYCDACRPVALPDCSQDAPAEAEPEVSSISVSLTDSDIVNLEVPEPAPAAAPAASDLVARDLSREKPRGSTAGDADLRAMVAQLAARVAALESDSKGVASVRQLPRALRLRIVRAYGRLRAERDAERAFTATLAGEAGDYRALIEAKLAAAEAEVLREREMRLNQVRGYSDTLAAAQAEASQRYAAAREAEARADAAESEVATLRRRVEVAEGAAEVAQGRQRTLEADNRVLTADNTGLRRQLAEEREGAGWRRIHEAARAADEAASDRDAGAIILLTPASRHSARA